MWLLLTRRESEKVGCRFFFFWFPASNSTALAFVFPIPPRAPQIFPLIPASSGGMISVDCHLWRSSVTSCDVLMSFECTLSRSQSCSIVGELCLFGRAPKIFLWPAGQQVLSGASKPTPKKYTRSATPHQYTICNAWLM